MFLVLHAGRMNAHVCRCCEEHSCVGCVCTCQCEHTIFPEASIQLLEFQQLILDLPFGGLIYCRHTLFQALFIRSAAWQGPKCVSDTCTTGTGRKRIEYSNKSHRTDWLACAFAAIPCIHCCAPLEGTECDQVVFPVFPTSDHYATHIFISALAAYVGETVSTASGDTKGVATGNNTPTLDGFHVIFFN